MNVGLLMENLLTSVMDILGHSGIRHVHCSFIVDLYMTPVFNNGSIAVVVKTLCAGCTSSPPYWGASS